MQLGPHTVRLGGSVALGLLVSLSESLEFVRRARLELGGRCSAVASDPGALGPRLVELEAGLLQLGRGGLQLEDAFLET